MIHALRRHPLACSLMVLCAACVLELVVGAAGLSANQVGLALIGKGSPFAEEIIWSLRMPRLLLALMVGGSLAACGAAVQAVFRNPLAEPGLIGVSAGAALGAAIVLAVLPPGLNVGPWALPLAAFIGAGACTWLIARIARGEGSTRVSTLLLTGVAVNAAAGAAIGLVAALGTDRGLRDFSLWLFGNLGRCGWTQIAVATPFLIAPMLWLPYRSRQLDALLLGEEEADHLGVDTERLKRECLILVVLGTGAAVACAGMIGFIGLLIPHLARYWTGVSHRRMLPLAALLGAGLLTLADAIARVALQPTELPVGVLTALIGGPLFLWLLLAWRSHEDLP